MASTPDNAKQRSTFQVAPPLNRTKTSEGSIQKSKSTPMARKRSDLTISRTKSNREEGEPCELATAIDLEVNGGLNPPGHDDLPVLSPNVTTRSTTRERKRRLNLLSGSMPTDSSRSTEYPALSRIQWKEPERISRSPSSEMNIEKDTSHHSDEENDDCEVEESPSKKKVDMDAHIVVPRAMNTQANGASQQATKSKFRSLFPRFGWFRR